MHIHANTNTFTNTHTTLMQQYSCRCTNMHIGTYIHAPTCMHTQTHACIMKFIHRHIGTCIVTLAQTCNHAITLIDQHIQINTHTNMNAATNMQAHINKDIYTNTQKWTCTNQPSCPHVCMHQYGCNKTNSPTRTHQHALTNMNSLIHTHQHDHQKSTHQNATISMHTATCMLARTCTKTLNNMHMLTFFPIADTPIIMCTQIHAISEGSEK